GIYSSGSAEPAGPSQAPSAPVRHRCKLFAVDGEPPRRLFSIAGIGLARCATRRAGTGSSSIGQGARRALFYFLRPARQAMDQDRGGIVADKSTDIANLLSPTVAALGLELLGVEYLPSPGGGAMLRLYIDRPGADPAADGQGVGIEDCEAVSREVSAQLDVEDPISSNYTTEVSKPDVDRRLFAPSHFERFLGEQAKVSRMVPQDGRRRLLGRIAAVGGDTVTFGLDGRPFAVAADTIDKARLLPAWVA